MYDVAIIGAGVIGASIARELSKYKLKIVVIDKEADVANGTTKANSAIVHAGYDCKPDTLMAKYNVIGNEMFDRLCSELDVPFKRCGSLVLAFEEEEKKHLEELLERGRRNGVPKLSILEKKELLELEKNLSGKVLAGLHARTAGIVGPWELTIALIENALVNGVDLLLDNEVTSIDKQDNIFVIGTCNKNRIESKIVINASGVYADTIHNMIGAKEYEIKARRGQYFIMDKSQGKLIERVIFQCPSKIGKGVLVAPTVHGNLLVGPDAEDIDDKDDVSTTRERLNFVREKAVKSIDKIEFRESIRNFAGLRAESSRGDFIVEESNIDNFFDVAGIKSPGLSAAPAIGLDLTRMVIEKLGNVEKKRNFVAKRKQIVFMELNPKEKTKLIREKPEYGRVICRCENITEGEIIDAIRRPLGATTIDGIKKRCRPGMGRCQGGFCGPRVQEILARELKVKLEEIVLDKKNSYILTGETK